jgi:hypothetical protein
VTVATLDEARRAKEAVLGMLEQHSAVNGVGVAPVEGGFAVKVNLSAPAADVQLPTTIEGVPIVWEVVGEVRKA